MAKKKEEKVDVRPYRLTVVGVKGLIYAVMYATRQQLPESIAFLPKWVREQAISYIFSAYVPHKVTTEPEEGVEAICFWDPAGRVFRLEVSQRVRLPPREPFLDALKYISDEDMVRSARKAGWIAEPKRRKK